MADVDIITATEALARARVADGRLWAPHAGNGQRQARDAAVLEAVEAGMAAEQIAEELGVLVKDVERMVTAARNR